MAGAAGFEPANDDTKNRCLTTWPRPNGLSESGVLHDAPARCKGVIHEALAALSPQQSSRENRGVPPQ